LGPAAHCNGLANAGIIDLEELTRHAKELSGRGISTSTFGVGQGFNEHLLEAMSNKGGGNFYYIDTPQAIPDLFLLEFAELAAVTASDVEISLTFPPGWKLEVPGGWKTQFSEGKLRIFLRNLVSGQTQEIYIRLAIPSASEPGEAALNAVFSGKGENGSLFEYQAQFVLRYADQEKVDASRQNHEIVERFALVYLAEISNDALKLERRGERDEASRLLLHTIEEYLVFVNADEVGKFQHMAERMKCGMEERDRKQSHNNSYNLKRGKKQ
jgi:Ca-activated chloride channel family protein